MCFVKTFLIFYCVTTTSCYLKNCTEKVPNDANCTTLSRPLIVTSFIRNGQIDEARKAAEVTSAEFQGLKSYSGYFTVSEQFNSNMFFLFFPSEKDYENAPVILWLQGGPGASSLIGAFVLNGPFRVTDDLELELKSDYWSQTHSMLYIDNPVGCGYSFTDEGGYAQNQTIIGEHLYEALQQFFQLFPELRQNDFFVTGESYAGKYVPVLSHHITKQNPSAESKINLKGLAIGNGFCDPENQLGYADYLYQIGLIDRRMKNTMQKAVDKIISYIREEKWEEGFEAVVDLIDGITNPTNMFRNMTGFTNYQNYLNTKYTSTQNIDQYVHLPRVKSLLHVGNRTFNDDVKVWNALKSDFLQSVNPLLTELLYDYPILFYNGQLDIIIAYPLTVSFLEKLKFDGSEDYETAERHVWYHGGDVAGYVKQAGKLTEVLVRNAGHMVPLDQPKWALDMITKFTRNQTIY